jgi:hypothetical protein
MARWRLLSVRSFDLAGSVGHGHAREEWCADKLVVPPLGPQTNCSSCSRSSVGSTRRRQLARAISAVPPRSAKLPRFCSKPREGEAAAERDLPPAYACQTSRIEATLCRQLRSCGPSLARDRDVTTDGALPIAVAASQELRTKPAKRDQGYGRARGLRREDTSASGRTGYTALA